MVKVLGPAMSLDASGKLAGAIVFSKWKGRNYIRQLVKPANPRSGGQVGMRAMFKFLTQQWKLGFDAADKATWEKRAEQKIVSPFNAMLSYCQKRWRNFTGPSKVDPATDDGVQANQHFDSVTPGERQVTVTWTVIAEANGWGTIIFRSLTTGFTPGWDNVIAVVVADSAATFTYVDSPLDPDTYYYRIDKFTDRGNYFAAPDPEKSAVVT